MNWAWATSLDQLWRSPDFPMWLTLAAAGFFGVIALITLLRAEKSVANGALTVITLLAVGVAATATIRGFGSGSPSTTAETRSPPPMVATLPALSCIDDLAGDAVLAACEKALFGSAESAAAALSYAASQITRLTAFGDVAAANKNLTPELQALRRSQSLELKIDLLRVVLEPNQQAGDGEHVTQISRPCVIPVEVFAFVDRDNDFLSHLPLLQKRLGNVRMPITNDGGVRRWIGQQILVLVRPTQDVKLTDPVQQAGEQGGICIGSAQPASDHVRHGCDGCARFP